MDIKQYYSYYDKNLKMEQITTTPVSSTAGEKIYYLIPDQNKILYNTITKTYSLGVFIPIYELDNWQEVDIED